MLKNYIKSPGKLILTLVFVGLLVLVLWSGGLQRQEMGDTRPQSEFAVILAAVYMLIFILMTSSGLHKGSTMFSMADVNMLFTAPVDPFYILIYGIIQQLATSVMVGFFFIFQYSWMHGVYGIEMGHLLLIILGYSLTVFSATLTAMLLYVLSSASDARRKIANKLFIAVVALLLLEPVIRIATAAIGGTPVLDAVGALSSAWSVKLFPLAGWMAAFTSSVIANTPNWIYLIITVAAFILIVVTLRFVQKDYYEDILGATENAQALKDRAKEGKLASENVSERAKKVRGSITSEGAKALYDKFGLEEKRASALLIDKFTLIEIGFMILMGLFMRFEGGWIAVLASGLYMQMVFTTQARWVRELLSPYAYLIPETPFRKLFWLLARSLITQFVSSVIIWIALGVIMELPPLMIILLIVTRAVLSVMFISGNLLVTNVWSNVVPRWLEMTLFFIMEIVLLIPGIAAVIAVSVTGFTLFHNIEATALLAGVIITIPVALGVMYGCRNLLVNAETGK
jgi:hypothetical protein